METSPRNANESLGNSHELLSDEFVVELAIMALVSVVKDKYEYASGQDFPNIPFGD